MNAASPSLKLGGASGASNDRRASAASRRCSARSRASSAFRSASSLWRIRPSSCSRASSRASSRRSSRSPAGAGASTSGKLGGAGCCAGAPSLTLELNAECGELLLDGARGAVAFVEQVPLGGCEVALRGRLRGAGFRLRQPCGQLAFPLCDPCIVSCELGGAGFELTLARLERLRTLECGTLAGHDRLGAAACVLTGLGRLSAAEPALEALQLALARGDRLGTLAKRLLQPLELGARIRLAGVPFRRELPGEPEQLRPVEVSIGFVGGVAASSRRPRVEALLPAFYLGSFRSAFTAPWCPFLVSQCSSLR